MTATLTKDPTDDHRFDLTRQMCQLAKVFGYPVYIVDGSLYENTVRDALTDAGATRVIKQKEKGMGASRRECIGAGLDTGAAVICWIEPEKVGMIPVLEPCVEMVRQGYDIVVPWRNRLYADYPPYQALSEGWMNFEMAQATGLKLDFCSGPRVMSRRAAELLLSYRGQSRVDPTARYDDDWSLLHVPILWAFQDGMRIGSCPVDYVHPAIQTALEVNDVEMDHKRDVQRAAVVGAVCKEAELIGLKRMS